MDSGMVEGRADIAAEALTPVSDPMEALRLLYTPFLGDDGATEKQLMPYSVLGPSPRGALPAKRRYYPFIEHAHFGGFCGLELLGAKDFTLTPEVAHKLVMNEWVEETSVVNVYKISLLGIAVLALHRRKSLDNWGI